MASRPDSSAGARPLTSRPLARAKLVRRGLPAEELACRALASGQCRQTASGALVLHTGKFTGRAPSDRYIVRDQATDEAVAWGKTNQAISPEHFARLQKHLQEHLSEREVFEAERHAGGGAGLPIRLLTSSPAHALFAHHLFQAPRPAAESGAALTILHSPECFAVPELHGTNSGTFIVLHPEARTILIAGTGYAGELKKSVFSLLNYLLPTSGILPMHAAVNVGPRGDSAVFFGLSGTGKTTLSADPERSLLGDDEHGWSDAGLFNIEGGCYAKTIRLSAQDEPEIWSAVHGPLALLENVTLDERGNVNWDDDSITENTRGAYPLSALDRVWAHDLARAPGHVLFLTADAFGVLPPVSRLTLAQAEYYFLSGYTAKLAGTEANQTTPTPTFSACFGAPFMPRPPAVYARLLRKRLEASGARVWLVNTGWVGGAPGEGKRMPIAETRRIVRAILSGELDQTSTHIESRFGLAIPDHVSGVRQSILDPRASWRDTARYDAEARALAQRFVENFQPCIGQVDESVLSAEPRLEQ